jgi:hypothetical protein
MPPNVGAWLGTTGQFAALEECDRSHTEVVQPADASDGAAAGPAICGVYLDDYGRITKLSGGLTAAALAG